MVVTRFAPSPTGRLHVGNIRAALHNWLYARQQGGRFMLRLDDTDAERSTEEFVDAIRADLAWLGLAPDGEERQSQRFALYEESFERLVEAMEYVQDTPEALIAMIEREAPTLEIHVRSGAAEAVARLKQAVAKGS